VSDDAPDDQVDGPDPAFNYRTLQVSAVGCDCGYVCLDINEMHQHLRFAHSAGRNPEITCQAPATWDHERWCVRAKGHDGKHWTPLFHGGMWWPR